MKKAATITVLLAIIATCLSVVFRNLAPVEDDGYISARERAIIKKFDHDGDGKLNQDEKREADAAVKAYDRARMERIQKFDTNGDGKLSSEERAAAGKASGVDRAALIQKFDQDGDGKLNEEEGRAARAALGR